MREYPKLPPNYNAVFSELTGPVELEQPPMGELIRDARKTAQYMSSALTERLGELDAQPYGYTFHDMPLSDGSLRVAITPSDDVYRSFGSPVWRVIINESKYVYQNGRPKEQWDIMDILVQPRDLRLGVKHARLMYVVGYGETGPPPAGIPPRIIRDVNNSRYSLSNSQGYGITLPEVPLITRGERLKFYQTFSHTAGTALEVFRRLSEVTRVDDAPNLEQNGEQ